jgi:glutamyl-tRNA(Gln) amidotransferase subunit D
MDLDKNNIGQLVDIIKLKDNKEIKYTGYIIKIEPNVIDLKLLDNSYNISINVDLNTKIILKEKKIEIGKPPFSKIIENKNLPNISYIGTGGTIGTHIDYKTGGVSMTRKPEEIIVTTPELSKIVNFKKVCSPVMRGSEDLTYIDWQNISSEVYNSLIDNAIDGIIISHGTDTLCWTGSAISFMIENINKPVLLVGAQRSPDRASFDGSMNLICAANFIKDKVPGVYVVMHGTINDDFCYITKAVKCKKLHTSRRDAFKSINDIPIAKVYLDGRIEYLKNKEYICNINKNKKPILNDDFEEKVAILQICPNSDPKILDWYIDQNYKGIILEGTALGHIPTGTGGEDKEFPKKLNWLPYIEKANKKGIILIMTSQSLFGRVNDKVYSNLRSIAKTGVEYLDQHDMLYSVAYIKLAIALKRFKSKDEIINFMKTNICGEISTKEIPKSFENSLV